MASVPRSEKIMASLASRAGISECGRKWLLEALDPFHDTMIDPVGYPDTTASASVIQVVKQSYQIASPLTSTTANWDCSITMLPWLNSVNFNNNTNNGGASTPGVNRLLQPVNTLSFTAGGIQVVAAASGTNCNITSTSNSPGTSTNVSYTVPAQYLQGNSRVVAMAMEICNTTSDLNRQGLVTCYRVPVPQNDDGTTFCIVNNTTSDAQSYIGSADGVYLPIPPQNIASAQLFAGTKAWAAELGSYQTAVFNTPDVPAQGLSFTMPILYNTSQTDSVVTAPLFTRLNSQITGGTVGYAVTPNVAWTEFDMSGSYFTGLSGSTTLTVNYVVYLERFPTQDDLDLIVSAKRSPEYDIKALEAYSIISQSLPVGVPFDENGLGDWFKSAVNAASEYISPVLKMIPHPYAQLGANAISTAKYVTDQFDQPPSDTSSRDSVPAPPMGRGSDMVLKSYAPKRRGGNVVASDLKKQAGKLKKAAARVRKDVAAEVRAAKGKARRR
jgi:hypothetical protein